MRYLKRLMRNGGSFDRKLRTFGPIIPSPHKRVLGFNQPVGLVIRRRIYTPLYSGVELYPIFVSAALFEPEY
jgi:hypothetical protein